MGKESPNASVGGARMFTRTRWLGQGVSRSAQGTHKQVSDTPRRLTSPADIALANPPPLSATQHQPRLVVVGRVSS
jgi:hypothetical protein